MKGKEHAAGKGAGKAKGLLENVLAEAKDRKYPSIFSLGMTALFAINFLTVNFGPVYSVLASIIAFFTPGNVLLDWLLPEGALEGFVERLMMSITLSICFTILFVSIVNLWLSVPMDRSALGISLISLNVLVSGARLANLAFFAKK